MGYEFVVKHEWNLVLIMRYFRGKVSPKKNWILNKAHNVQLD